jgi:HupE / UreJ protein
VISRWARLAAALLFCIVAGSISSQAHEHDLPAATAMEAFVKIDPDRAHLVIRVPLDLLRVISFPVVHGEYDMAKVGPAMAQAVAALASDVTIWANNKRLAPSRATGRIVPLSDRSFEEYDSAVADIAVSPNPNLKIGFELGYLDAHFTYPISSPRSVFAIQSKVAEDLDGLAKLVVRYLPLEGRSRVMTITSGSDRVLLDPTWYQVADGFVVLGAERFVTGLDNLLIVLCLIIPSRRIRELVPVIAAFAVGQSITLIAAAHDLAPAGFWFLPLIETGMAVSVFYLALANIVGANRRRRWIAAGLIGLIYGFGFADMLDDQLQFAGSYLLVPLLSFNIGIEIGLLAVLCVFVAALALVFRGAMSGRMGIIVLSAIVAHTAWHWMIDRGQVLWQTPWPQPTADGLMVLARWVLALGLAIAAAGLLSKWVDRKRPRLVTPGTLPVED